MTVKIKFNGGASIAAVFRVVKKIEYNGLIPFDLAIYPDISVEHLTYLREQKQARVIAEINVMNFEG